MCVGGGGGGGLIQQTCVCVCVWGGGGGGGGGGFLFVGAHMRSSVASHNCLLIFSAPKSERHCDQHEKSFQNSTNPSFISPSQSNIAL